MPDTPAENQDPDDRVAYVEPRAPQEGEGEPQRMDAGLEDLLTDLMDVDSDALREAEFEQIQSILDTLEGKTIRGASIEETRIVIETTDGNRYFFFGFMAGPK